MICLQWQLPWKLCPVLKYTVNAHISRLRCLYNLHPVLSWDLELLSVHSTLKSLTLQALTDQEGLLNVHVDISHDGLCFAWSRGMQWHRQIVLMYSEIAFVGEGSLQKMFLVKVVIVICEGSPD